MASRKRTSKAPVAADRRHFGIQFSRCVGVLVRELGVDLAVSRSQFNYTSFETL